MVLLFLNSCKKEITQVDTNNIIAKTAAENHNPFSYDNVLKAKEAISNRNSLQRGGTAAKVTLPDNNRLYTYLKFDPNYVTGDMLKMLEADSTIQVLNFPFANGSLYKDEFALDLAKAQSLAAGNLYAVMKKNSPAEVSLRANASFRTTVLNTL